MLLEDIYQRPAAGETPLVITGQFVEPADLPADIDGALCDFVVRPRDGTVDLRSRRGAMAAQGRRLIDRAREAGKGPDPAGLLRLDIDEGLSPEAAAAPEPAAGSWQFKVRSGLTAGVTQCLSTMFCLGLQHDIAESVLEGIRDHWKDLDEPELADNSGEAAMRIAHAAMQNLFGVMHASVQMALGPWVNRCLDAGSFAPLDAQSAALTAELDLAADEAIASLSAHAIAEQIAARVDRDHLLAVSANVQGGTGFFFSGLITLCVERAIVDEAVLNVPGRGARLEQLGRTVEAILRQYVSGGLKADLTYITGLMLAEAGGLVLESMAPPAMQKILDAHKAAGNGAVGMELFLAGWFAAVKAASADTRR